MKRMVLAAVSQSRFYDINKFCLIRLNIFSSYDPGAVYRVTASNNEGQQIILEGSPNGIIPGPVFEGRLLIGPAAVVILVVEKLTSPCIGNGYINVYCNVPSVTIPKAYVTGEDMYYNSLPSESIIGVDETSIVEVQVGES